MDDQTRDDTNPPQPENFERTVALNPPRPASETQDAAGDTVRFDDLESLLSDESAGQEQAPVTPTEPDAGVRKVELTEAELLTKAEPTPPADASASSPSAEPKSSKIFRSFCKSKESII